ncbi:MAG: antitoxin VapB family protein [Candidatus Nanohaloarchaea archaeon]
MGSKTISLKDEAYERLKALKGEDKSFSDVVIELTEDKTGNFESLIGIETDTTVEDLLKSRKEEKFIDEEREELLRGQ